jgi:hypothetical protein
MIASRIPEILERLGKLLRRCGEAEWANACVSHKSAYNENPPTARKDILAMYGGMGSFSDVVLYGESGQVLIAENDELEHLRLELHGQCRSEL